MKYPSFYHDYTKISFEVFDVSLQVMKNIKCVFPNLGILKSYRTYTKIPHINFQNLLRLGQNLNGGIKWSS